MQVNNQRQKVLCNSPRSWNISWWVNGKAAKVGKAAQAGMLWRSAAWLTHSRDFPSLPATWRAPACGTPPAQTAAECDTKCDADERVNFHQYQLLPARSKEQCPALWADQPRGICSVGNWISQPPGLLEPSFWGTRQDSGPLLVLPPCCHLPRQSPLPGSSTFPSTPSMLPAVGPHALNKPGLCERKNPPQRKESLHQLIQDGRRQERDLWEGRRVRVSSPSSPRLGAAIGLGTQGFLSGLAAQPCPAPCAGAPHQQELPRVTCKPRCDPDWLQSSPELQPGREAFHWPCVCTAKRADTALQSRVSEWARALAAALFLLSGMCAGLWGISAPTRSWLQDLMASVSIQALAHGCGCQHCVLVPGVCTLTVSGYEAF